MTLGCNVKQRSVIVRVHPSFKRLINEEKVRQGLPNGVYFTKKLADNYNGLKFRIQPKRIDPARKVKRNVRGDFLNEMFEGGY